MDPHQPMTHRARNVAALWFAAPLICCGVGNLTGAALLILLNAFVTQPPFVGLLALKALPFFALVGVLITWRFGLGSGLVAAAALTLFGYSPLRTASAARWVTWSAATGGMVGTLYPAIPAAARAAQPASATMSSWVALGAVAGISGAVCGALLGRMGWWVFSRCAPG